MNIIRKNYYALSLCYLILSGQEVCYDEHLTGVASLCLAQGCSTQSVLAILGQTHSFQHHHAVCVSIWITVSEEHLILVVGELYLPRQSIKLLRRCYRPFFAWIIFDVGTCPVPTCLSLLSLLLAVEKRLHAMVVEGVRFDQIYNIEFVVLIQPLKRIALLRLSQSTNFWVTQK